KNNNYKTLKPHSYVYHNRNNKRNHNTCSNFLNPHNLWRNNVTSHHQPISPPVRPCCSIQECILLIFYSRIPSDKKLCNISDTHNRTCNHDDNVHQFDMLNSNIVFKVTYFSHNDKKCVYHGESRENSSCHKVRR